MRTVSGTYEKLKATQYGLFDVESVSSLYLSNVNFSSNVETVLSGIKVGKTGS